MKNYLFTLTILLGAFFMTSAQDFHGDEASKIVKGAEQVWLKEHTAIPAFIKFGPQDRIPAYQFEGYLKETFKLAQSKGGLNFLKSETGQLGHTHTRYQQTYAGFPVEGSMIISHADNDQVYAINGEYYKLSGEINSSATMSETAALQAAMDHIGADSYKWEHPGEEAHLQHMAQGNPNSYGPYTYYPEGELVVAPIDGNFEEGPWRLAWKFDVYAHAPLSRTYTFVDAESGEVIFEWDRIHTADSAGTAATKYSGTQNIVADQFSGGFRLREDGRGNGIRTWNMQRDTDYGNAVDFVDNDNNWNNVNAQQDEVAGDAHWGAEMTYDYFFTLFNRNSIDNQGFQLNSYVHYDNNYANAFWDGQRMTYGDGNQGSSLSTPLTAIDIAGHEITHGLTTFSAGLIYRNESGALNESFSDIFGKAIEQFARPNNFSWVVGDDLGSGIRNMANPASFGDPRNYLGNRWFTGAGDNGGVHTNSGVQNHWYYLLVTGGTGTNDFNEAYSVRGIGFDTASAVAFRNLTVYLTPNSGYEDARYYAVQSAVDLYGGCHYVHEAVEDAWHAVGVGSSFSPVPVSDFVANTTELCSAPYTIIFTHQAKSAVTYIWDFGDGAISTSQNPAHTYQATGTYDVTLSVLGFCGGRDTLVRQAYINILPGPADPTAIADTVNCGGAAMLRASGTDQIVWYDGNGEKLVENDTLITPTLNSTTTYYAANVAIPPSVFGGPANPNFGGGGYFGGDNRWLMFDVFDNATLVSVDAFAETAGNRTIEYRDNNGNVLASKTVSLNVGQNTVQLGFRLLPGTDQQLAINGTADLFRNNDNVSYPYNIGSFVSITQSNANTPSDFYYFFYNWQVRGEECSSAKVPVTVTVNPLADPDVNDQVRCGPGSLTFVANNPAGRVNWYDNSGTYISTGNTFTTPSISATTQYMVESEVGPSPQKVGPQNPAAVGNGGYHNSGFDARLYFDAVKSFRLISVWVDAGSGGNRDIVLEDANGNLLQTISVNIPAGQSRINLGLDIQPGSYAIGGDNMDLYRNNDGANYPYGISGLVSITGSSAAGDFYYYLYDWEIQEAPCFSNMVPVTATINPGTSPNADFSYTKALSVFSFQDLSVGGQSWDWDFGDGNTSNLQHPKHSYATAGTYTVTLKVSNGECEETTSQILDADIGTALEDELKQAEMQLYPNPGTGNFWVELTTDQAHVMQLVIYNQLGQTVRKWDGSKTATFRQEVNMSGLAVGTYLVQLRVDDRMVMKKYVLTR